jgi:ketosteroid isomerase-like protein
MKSGDQDRLIQTWVAATEGPHPPSPERIQKLQRLRNLAMLRFSGRLDDLMSHISTDCELYVVGGSQFSPFSGRFHGHDEIRRQMERVNILLGFIALEFISIIVENDDVAIRWRCRARNQSSASGEWLEGMSVVHFRDGLITYYGNFLDTAALARLVNWNELVAAFAQS